MDEETTKRLDEESIENNVEVLRTLAERIERVVKKTVSEQLHCYTPILRTRDGFWESDVETDGLKEYIYDMLAKQFLKEKVDEEINFQESDFGMLTESVWMLGLEPEVEDKSEESKPKDEGKETLIPELRRSKKLIEYNKAMKKRKESEDESEKPKLNLFKIGMIATAAGLGTYGLTKYLRKDKKEI